MDGEYLIINAGWLAGTLANCRLLISAANESIPQYTRQRIDSISRHLREYKFGVNQQRTYLPASASGPLSSFLLSFSRPSFRTLSLERHLVNNASLVFIIDDYHVSQYALICPLQCKNPVEKSKQKSLPIGQMDLSAAIIGILRSHFMARLTQVNGLALSLNKKTIVNFAMDSASLSPSC